MKKTYTPKVKRNIEKENATPTAMEAFAKKLQSSNITEQLDLSENANPNDNFELFMNRFTTLNPIRSGGGGALKAPLRFFALTHLIFGAALLCVGDLSQKIV